jgi:DNA-binding transcriptional regulator YbjK
MGALAGTDTRERIMRTTLDLIGREGLAAVTNRQVATAAGTSLGTLTYHFASQHDLLRESLLLFVGEEVARLEGVTEDLRRRRPPIEEVVVEVEKIVHESPGRMKGLVEMELHLRGARDHELRGASRRCFDAYEELATASLEVLGVPDPAVHARSVVALLYGIALRRLSTGEEDVGETATALLALSRGVQVNDRVALP